MCECPGRAPSGAPAEWHCPGCDHALRLPGADEPLSACAVCGNAELYRKKDFPHGLGMTILVGACLTSTVAYWLYDKVLTWAILLGSAAFDGLLYLWVKDVVVCYRCNAHHRAVSHSEAVPPFELTVHERYRQERMRREDLEKDRATSIPGPPNR